MPASKSMYIIENEDYGIRLEYNQDYVIIHLPYVNKMSKDVFLDMKNKLDDWYEFFTTAGYVGIYAAIDPNDVKTRKLVEKLDFRYKGFADNMQVYFYGDK